TGAARLDFVIKVAPGGAFSNWIAREARVGTPARLFGPLGRAVIRDSDPEHVFAIAGGTGIAGIIPILEQSDPANPRGDRSGTLVFGVRTLADAFFLDRLDALARVSNHRIAITVAISDEPGQPSSPQHPNLNFESGLVVDVAERV